MTTSASTTEQTATQEDAEGTALEATQSASPGGGDDKSDREDAALSPETARRLQSENRTMRERLKTAEAEAKKAREAEMSEQEKLTEQTTTLRTELDQARAEARDLRVQVAASKLGILDPDAAAKLLDWDTVEDPSDPKQVVRALKTLIQERPYLAGTTQSIDAGSGRQFTGSANIDMNERLRLAAGRSR